MCLLKYLLAGLFWLAVYIPSLHAQKNPQNLISGEFKDLTIQDFTKHLEQQTTYFFYYDISLFDSILFTLSADHEPLTIGTGQGFFQNDFRGFDWSGTMKYYLTRETYYADQSLATTVDSGKQETSSIS